MIISAFAGSGKTFAAKQYQKLVNDLESSNYQWVFGRQAKVLPIEERKGTLDKTKNINFIDDYYKAIITSEGSFDYTLISSQPPLLDYLDSHHIKYTVAYPTKDLKQVYIDRYARRHNSHNFIRSMENNFNLYVNSMQKRALNPNVSAIILTPEYPSLSSYLSIDN